jgi:hypothetical protein
MSEVVVDRPAVVTDEHLEYLDELRESGETNMYGAGRWLQDEFGMTRNDSHAVLAYWMKTFSQRHGLK